MKTVQIPIADVKLNTTNPRKITQQKLEQLSYSILCFPQMLELRPVVVERAKNMVVLGGNMRLRALRMIAEGGLEKAKSDIAKLITFKKMKQSERDALVSYWETWFDNPIVPIVSAEELTDVQKRQFIIKDNSDFGTWDYDALRSGWDNADFAEWSGVGSWNSTQTEAQQGNTYNPYEEKKVDDESPTFEPTEFDEREQDGEIRQKYAEQRERVIIVYNKEQSEKLASFLGLQCIDKVLYDFEEIIKD